MSKIEELKNLISFSSKLNILFVEDNVDVKNQVIKMLENIFSNIDTAEDGKLGLEKYKSFFKESNKLYDIIITDLSMPNMSGVELTKEIIKINSSQIVVILTAHSDNNELKKLVEDNICKYIQKPINRNSFLEIFVNILNELKIRYDVK